MTEEGWPFDERKAGELYSEMVQRRDDLSSKLVATYGSWTEVSERTLVPKRDNKTRGYTKDVPVVIQKETVVTFNPGSREHCAKKLMEYGWQPSVFTPTGKPKLDEAVLETIDLPEAQLLIDYLIVQKRLGQLGDGDKAWLKLVRKGKVHATYNSVSGTVTFRASHGSPNIAQVPKVRFRPDKSILLGVDGAWGYECRALFTVPKGWKLVGADMAGAQLRALGHYTAFFDKGHYATQVTDGDIHTYHLSACAPHVSNRDKMKETGYAYMFGAQDTKLGNINGGGRQLGSKIRKALLSKIPALGKADSIIKAASAKGYLKALDGRKVWCNSDRLALNYALQSFEALVVKNWLVMFTDVMVAKGYTHGWSGDYVMVGWIHDECQVAVREHMATEVGELLVSLARQAGDRYKINVKLDSSYKIGDNWAETH